jgi:uncharacterized membrane protein
MLPGPVLVTLRLLFLFAGVMLAGVLSGTAPALADLRVCNQTGNQVSIALGYRAERGWTSEGWWVAPPGQCAVVYQGDLNKVGSSYFYLFAADDVGGGAWDGSVFMCTRDESFTIFGVEDCLARGYERTGFFEVDTQDRSDWMLQLTEGARPQEPGVDQTVPLDAVPADAVPADGGDVPADGTEETTE